MQCFSQNAQNMQWWKPTDSSFPTVNGQHWSNEMEGSLFRLPPRAESLVRKPVWDLSKYSTGLFIRFMSNAPQIMIRYKVLGSLSVTHMPVTSVSGLDLYGIDSDEIGIFAQEN